MLHIFRRIRQQLISTNKTKQYLLYAIGEIALVVIGILIALQINAWNEGRVQKIQEQSILQTLVTDLEQGVIKGQIEINRDSALTKTLEIFLLDEAGRGELLQVENADSVILGAIFGAPTNIPIIQVYEDIKSSGNTTLISSQKIRNKLAEMESQFDNLTSRLTDRLTVQQNRVDQVTVDYLNYRAQMKQVYGYSTKGEWRPDYQQLFADREAVNVLAAKLDQSDGILDSRSKLQECFKELIEIIREELAL